MNLKKKKRIAAAALGIGINRVIFDKERINEMKEAITKQDMRDLFKEGAIRISSVKGRHKKEKRGRRREGRIRRKVRAGKRGYILKIRKLRAYIKMMKERGEISGRKYKKLRNYAKSGIFKDLKHMIAYLNENKEETNNNFKGK